jgi:hypothetical protein
LQYPEGLIGDRACPYNASFLPQAAMPEPAIVNVKIGERR